MNRDAHAIAPQAGSPVEAPAWLRTKLVSFSFPAHDERDSLPTLLEEIRAVARELGLRYEIVVIDDGSSDGSGEWLEAAQRESGDLRVLRFPENRGQSAALAAALDASRGDFVVTMDADLQNDPADAARLLLELEEHDLACGVRTRRRDRWTKRIGSRIGNGFRRLVLKDRFRDVGCALKAWRRPVARAIPRFDGFHRFIPVLARTEGFRVVEVDVRHRHRRHGRTHYGNLGRALRGLADLFGVAWLRRRRIDTRAEAVEK